MGSAQGSQAGLLRLEIEEVLFRYARGVDRQDWQMVRSAYHPDATDLHGEFSGGIEKLIQFLRQRHVNIEQSLHIISNVLVEPIAEDAALVESYYICYQRLKSAVLMEKAFGRLLLADDETVQLEVVGRYVDRFEKREGAWRIADRKVAFDVVRTEATPLAGGLNKNLLLSRRDENDILWIEQRKLNSLGT